MSSKEQQSGLTKREFLFWLGIATAGTSFMGTTAAATRRHFLLHRKAPQELVEGLRLLEREPAPGSILFGIYPEMWPERSPFGRPPWPFPERELLDLQESLGQPIHLVGLFGPLHNPYFLEYLEDVRKIGAIPVISLEFIPLDEKGRLLNQFRLKDIAEGKYDKELGLIAEKLAESGWAVLRFGYEMNGKWFPWGPGEVNKPEDFIAAWIHAQEIFEKFGAEKLVWTFSPSVLHKFGPFFPKGYVDAIWPDGYDLLVNEPDPIFNPRSRKDPSTFLISWLKCPNFSFPEMFGSTLGEWQRVAPDLPFAIGEIGSRRTVGQGEWLAEAFAWTRRLGFVAVMYYYYDKSWMLKWNEGNWRFTGEAKEVLKGEFEHPAWAGKLTREEIVERLLAKPG